MTISTTPAALTVVDSRGGTTAVWRISLLTRLSGIEPGKRGSTITGAWVLPDDDPRIAAVTADSLTLHDPAAAARRLRDAVQRSTRTLQDAFTEFAATDHKIVPPTWPPLTAPALPDSPDRPEHAAAVLQQAQAIASLLEAWDDVEDERLRVANSLRGFIAIADREIAKRADAVQPRSIDKRRRLTAHRETAERALQIYDTGPPHPYPDGMRWT